MSKTFCPIPWIFQAPRSNGDLRVCCQANSSEDYGLIRKTDGTPYNAAGDYLEESRNANIMKSMRLNMLEGKWSSQCVRCRTDEDNGHHSRRMAENKDWWFDIDEARKVTAEDGTIDGVAIQYYDFRFGNKCNLACRMCGPSDSDKWYEDWEKLVGPKFFDNGGEEITIGDNSAFNWHESEYFWKQVENNMRNIKRVYFAGGEPTLIQKHYTFLEKCVESGQSSKMTIEYNTNITTLPARLLELWTHFKRVIIGASIDGYGDVLEYQRYPVKWDKVYNNMLKIDKLPDNVRCWFSYTVTVFNVHHTTDFINWVDEQQFSKLNRVKHHMAYNPPYLNVQVLPDEYKKYVTDRLDMNNAICKSISSYMNSKSLNKLHWHEFEAITTKLDKIRNQDIKIILPELGKYVKKI